MDALDDNKVHISVRGNSQFPIFNPTPTRSTLSVKFKLSFDKTFSLVRSYKYRWLMSYNTLYHVYILLSNVLALTLGLKSWQQLTFSTNLSFRGVFGRLVHDWDQPLAYNKPHMWSWKQFLMATENVFNEKDLCTARFSIQARWTTLTNNQLLMELPINRRRWRTGAKRCWQIFTHNARLVSGCSNGQWHWVTRGPRPMVICQAVLQRCTFTPAVSYALKVGQLMYAWSV